MVQPRVPPTSYRHPNSLSARFDPRRNSLNAIRLFLAVLVIVSHSLPLGGFGTETDIGGTTFGGFAVGGFFAISGYLITGSRINTHSMGKYLWRRFLRIYPAFVVSLFVVALVLAPLSVVLGGSGPWSPTQAAGFVVRNFGFYYAQVGIANTLQDTPYVSYWLGSLWTLAYEFLCYLAIGALVGLVPARRLGPVLAVAFVALSALMAAYKFGLAFEMSDGVRALRFALFFVSGALLYVYRERVRMDWILAVFAVLALGAAMLFRLYDLFGVLPMAYLMMWAGSFLPLSSIGAKNDLSYGVYIYGWPVQQLLATFFGSGTIGAFTFTALSIALTIPLAAASWFLVERRAMGLKDWRPSLNAGRLESSGRVGRVREAALNWLVAGVCGTAILRLLMGTIQDALNLVVAVAVLALVATVVALAHGAVRARSDRTSRLN